MGFDYQIAQIEQYKNNPFNQRCIVKYLGHL